MGVIKSSIVLVLVVAACATSAPERRPRSRGPTTAELSELLTDFQRAMEQKQLDAAEKALVELEAGIEQAPVSTITDPGYMRISAGADRARDELEAARGGASFAGWLESAGNAVALADRAIAAVDDGVTPERFAELERAAQRVERLVVAGEEYQKEPDYPAPAAELEERLVSCAERVERARWRAAATEALAGPLGDARRAEEALPDAPADRQRSLVGAMVAGFKSCAAVALLHGGKPEATDDPLITPYGKLAVDAVRDLCARRAEEGTARLAAAAETEAVRAVEAERSAPPPPAAVSGWQSQVADVRGDHAFAERERERAIHAGHRAERVVALANALSALLRCASRAEYLAVTAPAAEADQLGQLAARCRKQAAEVRAQLDRD